MFAVMFYDTDPDATPADFARLVEAYPRHHAYLLEFATDGDVLMIGTFGDPATQGSMALFRSRDAAERFQAGDPFVTEGLVHRVRIQDWDPITFPAPLREVLAAAPDGPSGTTAPGDAGAQGNV